MTRFNFTDAFGTYEIERRLVHAWATKAPFAFALLFAVPVGGLVHLLDKMHVFG